MQKKVLITGGGGFLGFHLSHYLHKKGFALRILDIGDFDAREYPAGTEFVKGDVREKELVSKVLRNIDFVVHAAAALPLWKRNDIFSINVDGTRNVLDLASKTGVQRVVFISSTAVYGIPKKHPIFENDDLVGVGPYGESKILAEKVCVEYRKKGMCVPVIRPKTFIGENRLGVFSILYDWVYSGKKIPMIGNGKNRYQLLEVVDLCDATYRLLIADRKDTNDTFNVGAKEYKTVKEDLQCLCDFAKSGARPVGTPAFIAKPLLSILEFLRISPLYKWIYDTANRDSFVSTEKIEKRLGWQAQYSNCEAFIRSYKWYLAHKSESVLKKEGVTHTVVWKQGVLKIIKKFF